jgi:dolichol-phosphate mannosyltransferase
VTEPAELRSDEWRTPVTVVVPTYNEADSLPSLVDALLALPLEELRVLVVDDDSPDGTGKLADELAQTHERVSVLHRAMKNGLGRAYVEGFTVALDNHVDQFPAARIEPEWIVQMDADGSHPVDAIPRLLGTALRTGADLVIGSRYVSGGSIDSTWGIHRRYLSGFGNWYANRILGLNIHDATAGFKLWSARELRSLDLIRVRSNGYAFQVEMNFLAHRRGCRIMEIPIHFTDRAVGQSKMDFRVKVESALRPWRLRWQYRGQHREAMSRADVPGAARTRRMTPPTKRRTQG